MADPDVTVLTRKFVYFLPVLRIWDVYVRIPDPNNSVPEKKPPDPGFGSNIKNLSIFNSKIGTKLSETCSGMFIPNPDPGVKKSTGSRIRIRNTATYDPLNRRETKKAPVED
jgi:hypothetical protein